MSANGNEGNRVVRTQRLFALDKLCDAFESHWQAGARPAIEDYLSQSMSGTRHELFEELLALEVALRRQQGEAPRQQNMCDVSPEFDTVVERVFAGAEWQQNTKVDQETMSLGVHRPRSLGMFGAYELLAEIGRGGMGVVYKAYQPSLDRTVAVKMVLAGRTTPQTFVERFRAEAKTLAKLLHPGIVPIFEVGEVNGQHFFSMEYVEGQSLAQRIAAGPVAPCDAARLVQEVAEVIHYAHEQGVLHRDIKPSNVLVSPQGRARVMDFGLAKQVEGDSQNTHSGEVLGTPSYMSPEQAGGRWREVDRRSDVYSLGAVLYALLVRRPPFQGESPLSTLLSVVQAQPVPPSAIQPTIEPELERICLKCLEKDPNRRYPTAVALAQDLDQYLRIDPAKSSDDSRRSTKRPHPKGTRLLASAILGVFALAALVITLRTPHGTLLVEVPDNVAPNVQVRATKDGVVEIADTESKWTLRLKEGKYDLQLTGGEDQFTILEDSIVITRNKETRATITSKSAVVQAPQPVANVKAVLAADPARPFARQERLGKQALVERPAEIKNVLSWTIESLAHRSPVTSLAFYPGGAQAVSCGRDGTLRIWDVATGQMQRVLVSSDELESCDVSYDGQYIAASGAQRLEIWEAPPVAASLRDASPGATVKSAPGLASRRDAAMSRLLKTLQLDAGRPLITRWSPDGRLVACAIEGRGVQIWDVISGKGIDVLPIVEPIGALAWNSDGSQIAFASEKNGIEVYRVATGERLHRLQSPKDRVTSLAWSKDSLQLAASGACTDAGALGVRIWSLSDSTISREITGTEAAVTQVAWQDDDRKLLLVLDNRNGELRDIESGAVVRKYENRNLGPPPTVSIWSSDGASAASADASGAVTFRATRTGSEIRRAGMAVHFLTPTWNNSMPALAWSAAENRIALATPNAQHEFVAVPGLWSMMGDVPFQAAHGENRHHYVVSLAWSDDGELLATGGSDPQTIVWNKDGSQRQVLPTGGWVSSLGFEPNSHRLAVGTQNGEIHLWDLDSKTSKKLASPNKAWATFRWSSDGKQIASAGFDGVVSLWNVESGKAIQTILKDRDGNGLGNVHCVDLSPDGKYLVVGSSDRAWIFSAESGEQVHSLAAGGWVYGVRFSPDSQRLAGGSGDGKLRIWSAADGKLERELPHTQMVMGVAWSPDGRFVACSTSQGVSVYQSSGAKQMDLVPLGMTDGLAVAPSGHVRAGNMDQLVYVLQTADGQVMVDARQMETRWGWKNDPRSAQAGE